MSTTAIPPHDGDGAEPDPLDECYRARDLARRHISTFRALVELLTATYARGDRDRARELFHAATAEWRVAERAMEVWFVAMRRARGE